MRRQLWHFVVLKTVKTQNKFFNFLLLFLVPSSATSTFVRRAVYGSMKKVPVLPQVLNNLSRSSEIGPFILLIVVCSVLELGGKYTYSGVGISWKVQFEWLDYRCNYYIILPYIAHCEIVHGHFVPNKVIPGINWDLFSYPIDLYCSRCFLCTSECILNDDKKEILMPRSGLEMDVVCNQLLIPPYTYSRYTFSSFLLLTSFIEF